MFRVGTNIIGVGAAGSDAVHRVAQSNVGGARFVSVGKADGELDFCCEGKSDFMQICDKLFMTSNGVAFFVVDCCDRIAASLACELCAVSHAMGSLTVIVAYVPSSASGEYGEAMEYIDELHEVCNGVVVVNRGYTPDFSAEVCMLMEVLSNAMDSAGSKRISGIDELRDIFDTDSNIFFAAVRSDVALDSHGYFSEITAMRLNCQTHLDIACNIAYFLSSGTAMPKSLVSKYVNAVDKKNIAYMSNKKAYMYENNPVYTQGEFLFAVLCSQ